MLIQFAPLIESIQFDWLQNGHLTSNLNTLMTIIDAIIGPNINGKRMRNM